MIPNAISACWPIGRKVNMENNPRFLRWFKRRFKDNKDLPCNQCTDARIVACSEREDICKKFRQYADPKLGQKRAGADGAYKWIKRHSIYEYTGPRGKSYGINYFAEGQWHREIVSNCLRDAIRILKNKSIP